MIRENGDDFVALIKPKFPVTLAAYQRVYHADERPPIPTEDTLRRAFFPYVVCWVGRRYASDIRRLSDDSSVVGFRAVTLCVGRTVSEVAYAEEKVTEAVEGIRLSIAGISSTPIHCESTALVAQDPDVEEFFASSIDWTWTCTRAQAA